MTTCPQQLVCSKEVRRLAGGGQLSTFEAMALIRKVMMTSLSVEQLLSDEDGDTVAETDYECKKKEQN